MPPGNAASAPSAFSFNSALGQCERCRGAGFEKIEMQFLSDVFIRCPDCNGRRYRRHILEVTAAAASRHWSIADLLDAPVDDAIVFLAAFPESRPARQAMESLKLLQEAGLGYLRLGQPINTLSGGESQRLKLVNHLAQARQSPARPNLCLSSMNRPPVSTSTMFGFYCNCSSAWSEEGHSVLVIEHNLDVMQSADWLIDLGPEAGDEGGQIVAQGAPETVAAVPQSHTGQALATTLWSRNHFKASSDSRKLL